MKKAEFDFGEENMRLRTGQKTREAQYPSFRVNYIEHGTNVHPLRCW